MKKYISPTRVSLFILLLLMLISFIKDDYVYVLLPISIFITFLVHELGHLLFGILKKAKLQEIVVGPFSYKKNIGFNLNKEWGKFGGLTIMKLSPKDKKQNIFYYMGGPVSSCFFGILLVFFKGSFPILISTLSFSILIITIAPYSIKGLNSDGFTIYQYLKNNKKFIFFNSLSSFLIAPFDQEINKYFLKRLPDYANEQKLNSQQEATVFLYELYNFILFNKSFIFNCYHDHLTYTNPFSEIINTNLKILDYIGFNFHIEYRDLKEINFLDNLTKNKLFLIHSKKNNEYYYYLNTLKRELNILKETESLTYKGETKFLELILLKKEENHEN
ncbi:M50 family metallopeptidase [Staphylococcus equorum]|uniref:M50 family metallopeptidase n=1 Tax=Staphylococcus equorum TaxID=246432 RepID=UPI003F792EDF